MTNRKYNDLPTLIDETFLIRMIKRWPVVIPLKSPSCNWSLCIPWTLVNNQTKSAINLGLAIFSALISWPLHRHCGRVSTCGGLGWKGSKPFSHSLRFSVCVMLGAVDCEVRWVKWGVHVEVQVERLELVNGRHPHSITQIWQTDIITIYRLWSIKHIWSGWSKDDQWWYN